MKPKLASLRRSPKASQEYAAWKVASSPRPRATNLWKSSWTMSAGAVTRQLKRNGFLMVPKRSLKMNPTARVIRMTSMSSRMVKIILKKGVAGYLSVLEFRVSLEEIGAKGVFYFEEGFGKIVFGDLVGKSCACGKGLSSAAEEFCKFAKVYCGVFAPAEGDFAVAVEGAGDVNAGVGVEDFFAGVGWGEDGAGKAVADAVGEVCFDDDCFHKFFKRGVFLDGKFVVGFLEGVVPKDAAGK